MAHRVPTIGLVDDNGVANLEGGGRVDMWICDDRTSLSSIISNEGYMNVLKRICRSFEGHVWRFARKNKILASALDTCTLNDLYFPFNLP